MASTPFDPAPPTGVSDPPDIDGIRPDSIATPTEAQEVAELLADADGRGVAVAPIGGGTALGLGNPPERVDLALSTERLRGVIDYEPTDLTLSVAAGSRFADVQAVLAEHGQTLPIEVPCDDRATIGGLIATALAGPRRYGAGTLRDLLIGISAAHPSGTVTKAGGKVVKNVTGFDLMRLYLGSLGTLGVVVSANFKVLPLPRFETTVLANFEAPHEAFALAEGLRSSRVRAVALEVARRPSAAWQLAARLEGRPETVRLLTAEAQGLVRRDTTILEGRESADWWRGYVAEQSIAAAEGEALVRCATRPTATAAALEGTLAAAAPLDISLETIMASPGLGTALLRVIVPADSDQRRAFQRFRADLLTIWDHVTVLACTPDWKIGIDVWGEPPATIDVMRAIKHQFDPNRVLNPGRFAGGI
jgi:glycolate dehydrogenase FAD-binding subunit